MLNIFNKEKINLGRQHEIDLARGFTALVMVVCHVGLYLGDNSDPVLYTFSDIIGSETAAPIFMALMGISIIYSRRSNPLDMLKRGINLFIFAYLLSAARSLIPRLFLGDIDEWTSIGSFFIVDILNLAGLTFMLLALFKKLKTPSYIIFIISLLMVFIDQYIMFKPEWIVENETLGYFVNLIWPVGEWSCFPLLIWFYFPCFGLCLGEIIARCKDKEKFYRVLLPVSLIGVIYVYYTFYILYPGYTTYYYGNNFYYMGVKNVILTSFFICFSLSFWYYAGKIIPECVNKFLTFLSVNLNVFYIISWLIIAPLIHVKAIVGIQPPAIISYLLMIIVIAVCYLCTKATVNFHKKRGK